MSAKPTVLPRWATDLSNNTEPLSGQKDTGWTTGQDGVSSYDNWFKYNAYLWLLHFSEGEWEGDTTINGDLTIESDGSSRTLTVEGFVVAQDVYHDSHSTLVPASAYRANGTTHSFATDRWTLLNATDVLVVPVTMDAGDQVTAFTVYGFKQSDATCTVTAELCSYHSVTGARTVISTVTNNANNPGDITLSATGLTTTVASPLTYAIEVSHDDASPSGPDTILGTVVTWERPAP